MANCINCGEKLGFTNGASPLYPGARDTFCVKCENKRKRTRIK